MKVKPAIRGPKNYCDYSDLKVKDTFIYQGHLHMKIEDAGDGNQRSICFGEAQTYHEMCGEQVLPVDAILTWTKKKE